MLRQLAARAAEHRLSLHAAALAYTTLLSLVPLLTVAFVVTAQIDAARAEQLLVQLSQLLPFSPEQVQATLTTLTKRAAGLGAFGLLVSLAAALNAVWQVDTVLVAMAGGNRRVAVRLTTFLTSLLVGPVLFVALLAVPRLLPAGVAPSLQHAVRWLFQRLAGPAVLLLLYRLVPPKKPSWTSALAGAVLASLLLALISKGVTLYWRLLPQLDLIYGPLSLLLLFLVSLFLSWLVFLLGAELALTTGARSTGR